MAGKDRYSDRRRPGAAQVDGGEPGSGWAEHGDEGAAVQAPVVAPQAVVKVFLTASADARAARRSADLATDPGATTAVTRTENERRDRADAPQTVMAADAIEVDSTVLPLDEVISLIVRVAGERGFPPHQGAAAAPQVNTARLS